MLRQQSQLIDRIVLQEIYLNGLGEDGGEEPGDTGLEQAISASFGNIPTWLAEFKALAEAQCESGGWLVCAWCKRFGVLRNIPSHDGRLALSGAVPILALDLNHRNHAPEFGADHKRYIEAYLNSLHFGRIAEAYRAARGFQSAPTQAAPAPAQISVEELKDLLADDKDAAVVFDVRHYDDRERYRSRIAETEFRDSFNVSQWAGDVPKDKPVIVYCMYGFWVSQKVAEELRSKGIDARSLTGGVAAWRAMGLPSSDGS